jgi:hypothetical protein
MAIVASYDWESDSWSHNGDHTRQLWREAVAEVAEKAKTALPQCSGRVDSAGKIVLAGDVELQPDGTARVASQSNGTTKYFVVNGECECPDYSKAPSNWCKHRIAAGIQKRAMALLKTRLEQHNSASPRPLEPSASAQAAQLDTTTLTLDLDPDVLAEGAPGQMAVSPVPLPEAPVSITLKATLNGHEVMVTLRGVDFASVKAQVEDASQWLQAQNGQSAGTEQEPASLPRCTLHGVALHRFERGGQVWHSHKLIDGSWCRGK